MLSFSSIQVILCIILSMSEAKTNLLMQQQRLSRGLKGIIVALLALIGILKFRLVASLMSRLHFYLATYLSSFALQVLFAFYLIFSQKLKVKESYPSVS